MATANSGKKTAPAKSAPRKTSGSTTARKSGTSTRKTKAPPAPAKDPIRNRGVKAFLLLALPAAVCYAFLHHGPLLDSPWHLPGIGLTVTQWLAAALCLLWAKREGRLRFRGRMGGALLLALSLGLGACFSLFADDGMRLMNLPVVILSTALSLISIPGIVWIATQIW